MGARGTARVRHVYHNPFHPPLDNAAAGVGAGGDGGDIGAAASAAALLSSCLGWT